MKYCIIVKSLPDICRKEACLCWTLSLFGGHCVSLCEVLWRLIGDPDTTLLDEQDHCVCRAVWGTGF